MARANSPCNLRIASLVGASSPLCRDVSRLSLVDDSHIIPGQVLLLLSDECRSSHCWHLSVSIWLALRVGIVRTYLQSVAVLEFEFAGAGRVGDHAEVAALPHQPQPCIERVGLSLPIL